MLDRYRSSGARYGWKQGDWRPGGRGYELVSEADLEADAVLRRVILGAFPEDGWLSEEGEQDASRLERERVWVVDPLDGTREFLEGVPEYAVSIGLVRDREAAAGVVYNPAADRMYAAAVGSGGDEYRLDGASSLAEGYMLAGRGEWRFGDLPPVPDGTKLMPVGSIAYRMALLATGNGCLIFTAGRRSEWDLAAGAALLGAAGAVVTDLDGEGLRFNGVDTQVKGLIAGSRELHAEALGLWRRSGWRLV